MRHIPQFGKYNKKADVYDFKTAKKIGGGQISQSTLSQVARSTESEEQQQEGLGELAKIDEISNDIIKKIGSIEKVVEGENEMRQFIYKEFVKGDLALVKTLLLHRRNFEERPVLYLGLAKWWQRYRRLGNTIPTQK